MNYSVNYMAGITQNKQVLYFIVVPEWSKFRDLLPLFTSRGLPLGLKGRL